MLREIKLKQHSRNYQKVCIINATRNLEVDFQGFINQNFLKMKDLKNLRGAKKLSKIEQATINGGGGPGLRCYSNWDCISTGRGVECVSGVCVA